MKFIAYTTDAAPLFQKAGVDPDGDAGTIALDNAASCTDFVEACRTLRFWERTGSVDDH